MVVLYVIAQAWDFSKGEEAEDNPGDDVTGGYY